MTDRGGLIDGARSKRRVLIASEVKNGSNYKGRQEVKLSLGKDIPCQISLETPERCTDETTVKTTRPEKA